MRSDILIISMAVSLALQPFAVFAEDSDTIGRIFTTPIQRAQIDSIRYAIESETKQKVVIMESDSPAGEPAPALKPLSLHGIIRSPSGETVYWINEISNLRANSLQQQNIEVITDSSLKDGVKIRLPEDHIVPLQVGDTYVPESGEKIKAGTRQYSSKQAE